MSDFKPIANPFIVGNPIKSRDMFFGRQDDFEYIKRKLQTGVKSYIIVFSGERRSGKTSILFQVLNGELGDDFLPILIDMQTMAGLQNENEFFEKIAKETSRALDEAAISTDHYDFFQDEVSPYKVFSKMLDDIHAGHPDKNILFLIDEYELIESKISEGSLNKNFVPFLAGVLESERKISFLFTGSKKLDERKSPYWNILFAKSLYRNVSFLSKNDTVRLITEPIKDHVAYDKEVIEKIYRLTAGQPFYTQVCCQNIVDHLNEKQKNNVAITDLDEIIDEILENPLPQMIYFWNSLSNEKKLILSLLSEILENSDNMVQADTIHKFSGKREFGINLTIKTISTTLETLYHQHLLKKTEDGYCFHMDLFRRWIKQDHSFWQVMKEISTDISGINVEETIAQTRTAFEDKSIFEEGKRGKSKVLIPAIGGTAIMLAAISYFLFLKPSNGNQNKTEPTFPEKTTEQKMTLEQSSPQSTPPEKEIAKKDDTPAKPKQNVSSNKNTRTATSSDAIKAQKSMLQSKNDAIESGAQGTSQFQNALSQENQAEKLLKSGDFESASKLYAQAGNGYSSARSAQAENGRKKANALLNDVNAAKENAQRNNAAQLATKTFSDAKEKESQGRNLMDQGRYDDAEAALSETQRLYSSAASEAIRSLNRLSGEIKTIQASLKEYKSQSSQEYKYLDEYQQALLAEQQGEASLRQSDEVNAIGSFRKAKDLYEQARTKQQKRVVDINNIIQRYRSALQNKNIQEMKTLCSNFSKQDEDRWTQFFEVANNLKAQFSVNALHFQQNSAGASIAVNLEFAGTKNSANWEMQFSETETGWIISKISEGK
jgi:AAA+ ATPase superfamily predicted ATPase